MASVLINYPVTNTSNSLLQPTAFFWYQFEAPVKVTVLLFVYFPVNFLLAVFARFIMTASCTVTKKPPQF